MTKTELRKMTKLTYQVEHSDLSKVNVLSAEVHAKEQKIKIMNEQLEELERKIRLEENKLIDKRNALHYFYNVTMNEHKEDLAALRAKADEEARHEEADMQAAAAQMNAARETVKDTIESNDAPVAPASPAESEPNMITRAEQEPPSGDAVGDEKGKGNAFERLKARIKERKAREAEQAEQEEAPEINEAEADADAPDDEDAPAEDAPETDYDAEYEEYLDSISDGTVDVSDDGHEDEQPATNFDPLGNTSGISIEEAQAVLLASIAEDNAAREEAARNAKS